MSLKNTKKKFDKKKGNSTDDQKTIKTPVESTVAAGKSKHIVFDDSDDENNVVKESVAKPTTPTPTPKSKSKKNRKDASDIGTLWYQLVSIHTFPTK